MWFTLALACSTVPPAASTPAEEPPPVMAEAPSVIAAPPPVLTAPSPVVAAPPPSRTADRAVEAARGYLGTRYRWDGRGTGSHPGLDCLGLLYRGYGDVTGTSWRAYPVDPSLLVKSALLGTPVPGLDGVLRKDLDPAALVKGDVLYFLLANHRIEDEPLWHHDGFPYWPWHTGMYVGDGKVIQADPWDTVQETDLYEVRWDALFVTRVD